MLKNDNVIQLNPNWISLLKKIVWIIFNLFLVMPILCLYVLKPVLKIQFLKVRDDRIGHLAANTELFLRRLELGIIKKKRTLFVGIASTKPSNKQLLKMFKRKMIIIQLPKLLSEVPFSEKSLLVKIGFGMHLLFETEEYHEFNHGKPNLDFTPSEEKEGEKLLKKMGLTNKDWFICFHARDPEYLAKHFSSKDCSYWNFRDSEIKNYLKAAEYITSKGGYAIRMGQDAAEKLPRLNNKKIIDYAFFHRSDFGDIYLSAKCKFFLVSNTGIYLVPQIFNVPLAEVNVIPLRYVPLRKGSIFIPKKIWHKKKKRFLTFKEIVESGVSDYLHTKQFDEAGLIPIENSAEEILELAIEMNERLDKKFKYTKEDKILQKKFKSILNKHPHCHGFPSEIGTMFLRKNKELLK